MTTSASTSPNNKDDSAGQSSGLSFLFRGKTVPVTYHPSIRQDVASMAIASEPFQSWISRCGKESSDEDTGKIRRIDIHSVEIQSVDMFGKRVGFVKIKSNCTLIDGDNRHEHQLPGICFLRGNSVSILVALKCDEDNATYSLLVDQPRIPIGQVSTLELPAGMIDPGSGTIGGVAAKEMEEECGITVKESDLIDLTELAYGDANNETKQNNKRDDASSPSLAFPGIHPSPGGCDEAIRLMYLERDVTKVQLDEMRGRLAGLREEGEVITLRVVPFDDIWKVSADAKAICAMFLLNELRKAGKLEGAKIDSVGQTSGIESYKQVQSTLSKEPALVINNGVAIPQLAFGLYKVPPTAEGEEIILQAIKAGYRHFDTASYYNNEEILGKALKKSGIPRSELFLCSKVWNDAQKKGRAAVRESFERSLAALDSDGYLDLYMVHWPVPGHHVDTYKELESLHQEGKIKSIGISNYSPEDYEELVKANITITPAVNQMEVSPAIYRASTIRYFREKGILISASKALHRGESFDRDPIRKLASKYFATPAQIILRWATQKKLIVVSKTATPTRMRENRSIFDFSLTADDMALLDAITTEEDVKEREELEAKRKNAM